MCAGASCCENRQRKEFRGAEKQNKRASKRATVVQARRLTVDLAALESEDKQGVSATPIQATARSAPPCMSHDWGVRVGLPRHNVEVGGVVVKGDVVLKLRVAPLPRMQCSGACPKKTKPPSCSTSTSMLAAVT